MALSVVFLFVRFGFVCLFCGCFNKLAINNNMTVITTFLSIYFENLQFEVQCGKSVPDSVSIEDTLRTKGVGDHTWEAGAGRCRAQG